MPQKGKQLLLDDRKFGYWNGKEGRVRNVYVSEELREAVGDLLVNVRELNDTIDELKDQLVALQSEVSRLRKNSISY